MAHIENTEVNKIPNDNENNIKLIVDSLPASVALIDENGKIVQVNDAWIEFAYNNSPNKDLVPYTNFNYFEVCEKDDTDKNAQKALKGIKEVLNNKIAKFDHIYPCHSPNQERWFLMRAVKLKSHKRLIVISHIDITEQQKAKNALKRNEYFLNEVQQISKFGGWEYDVESGETYFSDEVFNIYGIPNNRMFKAEEGIEFYHPDDRGLVSEAFSKAISDGIPYELEVRFINAKNENLWVNTAGKPVSENGKVVKILGTLMDITERKKAEQALKKSENNLRFLNNMTREALEMEDINSIYDYISSSLQKLLPNTIIVFSSVDSTKNNTCIENAYGISNHLFGKVLDILGINPIGRTFKVIPRFDKLHRTGKLVEFKKGLVNFAEDQFPSFVAKSLEKIIGLHKIYTIGISKDEKLFAIIHFFTVNKKEITNSEFIEAFVKQAGMILQIKTYSHELEKLNKDKDKFMSILAHDLKTPFNSLLGFSDLLVENVRKYDIDTTEKYIKYIDEVANNSFTILEDILELSFAKTGRKTDAPGDFPLHEICNQVIDQEKQLAQTKNIALTNNVPPKLNVFVTKKLLRTVLRNLISNAIKFTDEKGTITIDAIERKNEIVLSVKDTGVGIDKEVLPELFNTVRIRSTLGTANEKGTGLGLQICKEFVEKMGGKIWVESKVGKGTTFYFTIPMVNKQANTK